jgi:hypothetical protein
MKQYILLHQNEDGNPVVVLEDSEVQDIKQLMEDNGITQWRENFDETDTNYWDEGDGMLLEVEIKIPKRVKVVETYELD